MTIHKAQVVDLVGMLTSFSTAHGADAVEKFESSVKILLLWIAHLKKYCMTGVANELLDASQAAIRESAALLAVGAVRPALFSMRAQIDLILGWLYFKDHPVEYALVNRTGDGFRLKKDILSYLNMSFVSYGEKLGILSALATRKELDPYRLLSAHIHAQSTHVLPTVADLKDIVYTRESVDECVVLQGDVAEFLSDHLFALGIASSTSLPAEIVHSVMQRKPTKNQQAVLFG